MDVRVFTLYNRLDNKQTSYHIMCVDTGVVKKALWGRGLCVMGCFNQIYPFYYIIGRHPLFIFDCEQGSQPPNICRAFKSLYIFA